MMTILGISWRDWCDHPQIKEPALEQLWHPRKGRLDSLRGGHVQEVLSLLAWI